MDNNGTPVVVKTNPRPEVVAIVDSFEPWVDPQKFVDYLSTTAPGGFFPRDGAPRVAVWYHQPGYDPCPLEGATVFYADMILPEEDESVIIRIRVASGSYRGSKGSWFLSRNPKDTRLPSYSK